MIEWINPRIRKPEGKIFWALTKGRSEHGGRDWEIIRLLNDEHGDYRTLDYAGRYDLPNTFNYQSWCTTIFAWTFLDSIPIDDYKIEGFE